MTGLERYHTMLAERGIRPFQRVPWVNPETGNVEPRVLGESLPLRWRVSRDEWDRVHALAADAYGWSVPFTGQSMIAGWPVDPDDTLPPRSIVLEDG